MKCTQCGADLATLARFCPSCGSPVAAEQQQKAVTHDAGKPPTRRIGKIVFPAVLVVGLGLFIWYVNPSTHKVIKGQPVVAAPAEYDTASFVTMKNVGYREEGDDLVFSLDEVKQHKLVRIEYIGKTTPRPVLAYIAPDGRLVTAISVSDHCGSTEFKIKGSQIYCARCSSRWDMMTMEAYACCAQYYPDPIPSRVVGNEVRVSKQTVEKWAGRL